MIKQTPVIPEMKVGLVVVTPTRLQHITPDRKYVIEKVDKNIIYITNDDDELTAYHSYQFMEADLYYTMCFFSTLITLYKLGAKAYK